MSNKKSGFGKFLAGAAIGAGLGILFAPKKGSETRAILKEKLDELMIQIKKIDVEEIKEEFEDRIQEIKEELADLDKEKVLELAKEKSIQIRNDDNSLNRKNLGILLFSDRTLLEKHENIIYPELTKKVLQFISDSKTNDPKQKIILNATVLFKTPKLLELCDSIFFVQSNYAKRLLRAKHRDNSSFKNIIKLFSAQ